MERNKKPQQQPNTKKEAPQSLEKSAQKLKKSQSLGKLQTSSNGGKQGQKGLKPDPKQNNIKTNNKPSNNLQASSNKKPDNSRQGSVAKLQKNQSSSNLQKSNKADKKIRPKSSDNASALKNSNNKKGVEGLRGSIQLGKSQSKQVNNKNGLQSESQRRQPGKSLAEPASKVNEAKHNSVNANKLNKNQSNQIKQEAIKTPATTVVEEKELGLVMMKPQFDKLILEPLEITDSVYEKYFDMISNDNDTIYVLNSIPEIKDYRKEEDADRKKSQSQQMQPILTGRMSKISGLFDHFTIDKVINSLKNKPAYLDSKAKPNNMKLIMQTRFKVSVDIGFIQYLIEGDKLVVTRLYLSKIYRKMNYLAYVILQCLRTCLEKHTQQQKCCIFLHDRNLPVVKLFKYMGFKIQRILTDSKTQKVDYFQEFTNKRKQFLASSQALLST